MCSFGTEWLNGTRWNRNFHLQNLPEFGDADYENTDIDHIHDHAHQC